MVEFREDTPPEIIKEFWRIWPEYHAKVVARQESGLFSSAYPMLPDVDPNENRVHYGAPLISEDNRFTVLFQGMKTFDEMFAVFQSVDKSGLSRYELDELKVAFHAASDPIIRSEIAQRMKQRDE